MGIKVTREMLDKYRKLKQEIPVLELELMMMKNTEAGLGNRKFWNARKRRSRLWISGLMTSRMDRQDACFGCSTSRG